MESNSNTASRTSLHSGDGAVVCPPIGTPTGETVSRKRGSGISKGTFNKKEQIRCTFCGGRDCGKCGLNAYKQLPHPAIKLLHSAWITDYIIGMQRPNDPVLEAGALQDMVEKKITAVFNLTEPGEHPYCGTGVLADSGFPYSPEKLMAAGIKHFNFSWKDMTVPPMQMMMDIVNIACNEIATGGKIAVHCHAGFGRTGITIACILIAYDHLEAGNVVQFIRNRRPGSVQTSQQQQFVHKFEKSFHFMMQIFPVFDDSNHQLLASFEKSVTLNSPTSNAIPAIGPPSASTSPSPHSKSGLSSGDHHTSSTGSLTTQQQAQLQAHRNSIALYSKSIATSAKDQQYFLSLDELHSKDYTYSSKIVIFTANAIAKLSKEQFVVACLAITGLTKLAAKNASDIIVDERIAVARADKIAGIASKMVRKRSSFVVATNSLSESSEERLLTEIKLDLNKNNWSKLSSFGEVLGANFKRSGDSLSQISKLNMMDVSHSKLGTSGGSRSNLGATESHQSHSHPHPHHQALTVSHSKSSLTASPPIDGKDTANVTASPRVDIHRKSLRGFITPAKDLNTSIDTAASTPAHLLPTDSEEKGGLFLSPSSSTALHSESHEQPHHVQHHHQNHAQQHLQQNHSQPTLSRISSPATGNKPQPAAPQSPPPMYATPPPDANNPNGRRKPSLTTIKRATSLKLNSEADYSKSKKIAANTVSQLLLDWLETRQDALFSGKLVERLASLWKVHGGISKSTNSPMPGGNRRRTVSDSEAYGTGYTFTTNSKNGGKLVDDVSLALKELLDRYKLELLDSIVEMYRTLRLAGVEYIALKRAAGDCEVAGTDGCTDAEALEALVCLRLSIALTHARKVCPGLVRHRALMMDVTKVFLLKCAQSEVVLINNIAFTEENYASIERALGTDLIRDLDVVFRTLRLLSEEAWCADVCRKGMQIGWSVPDLRLYGSVPEDGPGMDNTDQDMVDLEHLKETPSISTEESQSFVLPHYARTPSGKLKAVLEA